MANPEPMDIVEHPEDEQNLPPQDDDSATVEQKLREEIQDLRVELNEAGIRHEEQLITIRQLTDRMDRDGLSLGCQECIRKEERHAAAAADTVAWQRVTGRPAVKEEGRFDLWPTRENLTMVEVSSSIGAALVFPRIVPMGLEAVACVLSGPITQLTSNQNVWFAFYLLQLHGTVQYNVFMSICFCFRFYVLQHESPSVNQARIVSVIAFSFTFVLFVLFGTTRASKEVAYEYVHKYVPQYDLDPALVIVTVELTKSLGAPAIIWTVFTAISMTFVNVFVGRAIFSFLNDFSTHLSERTRNTHRQFAVALTIQAVLGQLILFAALSYTLGQLDVYRHPIMEYSTHMVSEFCIATSPIITLVYVKPYRLRLMRLAGRKSAGESMTNKSFALSVHPAPDKRKRTNKMSD